jgi:hypothetical protein
MAIVTEYNYQYHGGPGGYAGRRAILRLKNGTTSLAYVYFMVEGHTIPSDNQSGTRINMYMPESALEGVIDMLRNESPIEIYYASGSAFLRTGSEPIGEEEGS